MKNSTTSTVVCKAFDDNKANPRPYIMTGFCGVSIVLNSILSTSYSIISNTGNAIRKVDP